MNFDENHVPNEYPEENEKLKALNYENSNFGDVYKDVKNTLEEARSKTYASINFYMVKAYWQIGKIINEAQDGNKRAEYGRELINELSKNLTIDYGKGFDKSNLSRMRKFYSLFNNIDAMRQELSWTHYRLIIKVDDKKKRNFYIDECIKSNWSTRQLER